MPKKKHVVQTRTRKTRQSVESWDRGSTPQKSKKPSRNLFKLFPKELLLNFAQLLVVFYSWECPQGPVSNSSISRSWTNIWINRACN